MTTKPFLKPRITGPRFTGATIPLEFLADLAVLSEMILEVAKWKYRNEDPNRKRVPPGFAEGVSLNLTGIEEGSAIPVISLVISKMLFAPAEHYFEEARDSIISAVVAAQNNKSITEHLPQELLGYFDRFGRNLADGEAIELNSGPSRHTALLTKEIRRKLLRASSATHYTEETSVYGLVHEFDQRAKTFQFTLPEGSILKKIPVESQHYDAILEASNGFRNQQRVRLSGVGRFDLNNRLLDLLSVEHVLLLDPLDISVRVDELKQLQTGWLDGKGRALDGPGLDWVAQAFATLYPDDAKLPYLFPTPEGNLLAEWSLGSNSVSLEIDLKSQTAEWHVLNIETDEEDFKQFNLNTPINWQKIAAMVKDRGGVSE